MRGRESREEKKRAKEERGRERRGGIWRNQGNV